MFSSWLTQELKRRGWSHSELARRTGVSQVSVSGVIAGSRRVSCDFCIKVADALGESPEHLLRLAGILPAGPPDEDPILTEILDTARAMSPEQRQDLLKLMKNFFLRSD